MTSWQPPPSFGNDSARRAQQAAQDAARQQQQVSWMNQQQVRQWQRRPARGHGHPFLKFLFLLLFLAVAGYIAWSILAATH